MANTRIEKTVYGGPDKHILIADDSFKVTLSGIISDDSVVAGEDGRKVVKAGMPLYGDTEKRNETKFKTTGDGDPSCLLLHDVDVTDGENNGTILLAGCVDLLKVDETVRTINLTTEIKGKFKNIIFTEGSAI